MASPTPQGRKLNLQVPVLKVEKDPAFYIVPPLLLAAVFAFCAYVPRDWVSFKRPVSKVIAVQQKPRVELPDPNATLPAYAIPAGCANLLQGAEKVTVSAAEEAAPALNAVNGSCADDAHVAVARPSGGPAWWQVELPKAAAGQELVIYGGGSKSPAGKLEGGFSVEVTYEGGEVARRSFCREGFALEGHETMKLDEEQKVKSVRITALRPQALIVLREVQLIGSAD